MRAFLSVRGLSALPLVIAIVSAVACNGSPSQPGPISDSASDSPVVSRSRPFDAPPSLAEPTEMDGPADTDYLEEEFPEGSELTDAEEIVDASDLDVNDLEASGLEVNGLTAGAPIAATARGTVALSGVIKDKSKGRVIPGVTVKIGSKKATTSSKGVFLMNVPKGSTKITLSKTGYVTKTVTKVVTRSVKIEVLLTPASVALSKVTLSDNDVSVGTMVDATATLTNAAPSGGAKVLLSSLQSAVAKVQSTSVTIPAGKKSASFKVRAESAGTAVIKGTYNGSKTATLKVGGPVIVTEPEKPPPSTEKVVARFTYAPNPCVIVASGNQNTPLRATCTFNASASTAFAGSTYTWTFPGGEKFTRNTPTLENALLTCGSLPDGTLFQRTVYLFVDSPSNGSDTQPMPVNFKKSGPC